MPLAGVAAGQHALGGLPGDVTDVEVVARAVGHDVALEGLASFTADGRGSGRGPALAVGNGRPAQYAFATAVSRLWAALTEAGWCQTGPACEGEGPANGSPRPGPRMRGVAS